MNDLQLYQYYVSIPLATWYQRSRIYPKYVQITGRSVFGPHPHRHYSLEEFIDKLDDDFKNMLLNKTK